MPIRRALRDRFWSSRLLEVPQILVDSARSSGIEDVSSKSLRLESLLAS